MGRDGLGAVDAFDRLRREARSRRIKVVVVAAELLESAPPDTGGGSRAGRLRYDEQRHCPALSPRSSVKRSIAW